MCNWMPTCCREAAHKNTEIKRLRTQRDKAVEALREIACSDAHPVFTINCPRVARAILAEIVEKNDD